jgi:hypothetical protein
MTEFLEYMLCLVIVCLVCLVLGAIGFSIGRDVGERDMQRLAVKYEHAYWKVINDSGQTSFDWFPPSKEARARPAAEEGR